MSKLSHDDWQQVEHVARLAVLAMCARSCAHAEHEAQPEISRLVLTVTDLQSSLPCVELEYFGPSSVPLGGVAL